MVTIEKNGSGKFIIGIGDIIKIVTIIIAGIVFYFSALRKYEAVLAAHEISISEINKRVDANCDDIDINADDIKTLYQTKADKQ